MTVYRRLLFGIFSAAFGNIGLGLALGVAFGAALDWHGRDSHDGDDANPEEPPISNGDADDGSAD